MTDLAIPTLRQHLKAQQRANPFPTRKKLGVSGKRLQMVECIEAHPGCGLGKIIEVTGIPTANVSASLTTLVKAGVIWRVGIVHHYRYWADKAEFDKVKDKVHAEIVAEAAAQRETLRERCRAYNRDRQQKLMRGEWHATGKGRPLKPRAETMHGKAEAYITSHQGCKSAEIRTAIGASKGAMNFVFKLLTAEGSLWRVGDLGSNGCTYYTDRTLYEQAQSAWDQRKREIQVKHEAARDARHKAAREKVLLAASAKAKRDAEKAERIRAAEAEKERRQKAADAARAEREQRARQRAEAEAERQRLAAERLIAARKPPAPRVVIRSENKLPKSANEPLIPPTPTVNIRPQVTVEIVIDPNDPRIQRIQPRPDPRAARVPEGGGAISQDWAARRRGEQIPSRLQGAYA